MDLTKLKKQPMVAGALVGIALIALFGAGITKKDKDLPIQPSAEPAVQAEQTVPPAGVAAIKTHTVREGETLGEIAELYQIDVDTILGANPDAGETVYPGDKLAILPQKGVLHTVTDGDTLWRIASVYGVELPAILTANDKKSEGLAIGEKLFIPGGKPVNLSELPSAPVSRSAVSRFIWPTNGEITSPFGRRWGRMHEGIDIANDVGTPITAALPGRVTYTGWYGGYGYTVMMEHNNGYSTLYGHMSGFSVSPGQYVRAGQKIGQMGNTGYSTGPHLHFEVHKDGEVQNPMNYLP